MDTKVLRQLSYGLYAIGVNDGGRPTGCIVNTVFQITSQDPIIAISMNKENYTFEVIQKTGQFAVSILGEGVKPNVIAGLGFASGREKDKFGDIAHRLVDGMPIVQEGCTGYMVCDVYSMTETPTHMVILGKLRDAFMGEQGNPMTYQYYHEVIKGKAPKAAPTYQAPSEPETDQVVYVCEICGYEYVGDITQEPDDFKCPICGVSKEHFKRK